MHFTFTGHAQPEDFRFAIPPDERRTSVDLKTAVILKIQKDCKMSKLSEKKAVKKTLALHADLGQTFNSQAYREVE